MKPKQFLSEWRDTDRQALYNEFGDDEATMQRVHSAFEKSDAAIRPQIEAVFGREAAARFFALLEKEF